MPALFDNADDENRDAQRSPVRRLYIVGVVFIAAAIFGAWFAIRELRRDQLLDVTQDTNSLAIVLAAQTSRTFQAVDVVLREAQALAQASDTKDVAEFRERVGTDEVHRFLVDRLHELPQADALSLIDETGRIVNFTRAWPMPVVDNSDRDFYAYWREHDDALPLIGEPIIAKVTGTWVLTITRRINGPHGEFRGIALGAVRADYFEDFYKAIRTGEGEAISLFRRDGTLLGRYPHLENAIGQEIPSASPWYKVLAAGGGPYMTPGYVGGEPRIISLQPVRDYPLAITVGITQSEALAPWRRQADFIVIGTVGAVAGFAALIWALRRQFQRLEDNKARFRGFATTSSDWFWETDANHRITYISESIRAFGQDPKTGLGKSRVELAADVQKDPVKWQNHLTVLDCHEPFRNFVYKRNVGPQSERTISTSGDPYFDRSGRFLGYRGTAHDITDVQATEDHLRETMQNLDRAQRIAGIGSTTEDLVTREYEWSAGACAIFGINSASVGKTVEYMRQFYHPADRAKVIEAAELARLKGTPAPPLEYRIVRPDGAVRWVYRQNDIQYDPEGRALRRIVTFRDITERKEKEIQLREAMDHLNRVQRIAGIGNIEVDLTTETEQIKWSPSACELFGLDHASVESTPEFLLKLVHPDDRTNVKKASDRANRSGTAAPPLEYRIIRADGAERVLYRENAIQYDDSGQPVRRIVTYKDITELKATEARLYRTQEDLNHAQRLAKVGSDVWDLRTGEVTWSEETYRIFGVDPDTFTPTAENFVDFVVPEDRPGLLARRQELLKGKRPAATQIRIRRPDGEVRHIYSEAELTVDEHGEPVRWVGMRQDITAQMRTEQSLRDAKEAAEAANVAKSQFLANTSHELRTPLNAIIGFSEMLALGMAGRLESKQKEYVRLVHDSGKHLLNIINDILDLAHVDSGRFELRKEPDVNIREAINACVALMKERANDGGLQLSTEIDENLPLLVADPTRLKQILLNLMSNAIKFTEPGGSVAVTGRRGRKGCVVIEVRDTGPGMTSAEIKIALEPFGQVDAGHARQHEGTGLGLPLARRLAELHGGSLHVSSQKGKGTTVSVKLPALRTTAADLEEAVSAA